MSFQYTGLFSLNIYPTVILLGYIVNTVFKFLKTLGSFVFL